MNPGTLSNRIGAEQALVKVVAVRSQNRFGVIFRGQRIKPNGELLDTHNELIVKAIYRDLAVPVMIGQWWKVKGKVEPRQFINNLGFEMTEEQMKVDHGGAAMVMPCGVNIVDYLTCNPRFQGIGRISAERLWETFGGALLGIIDVGNTESLEQVVTPRKAATLVEGWRVERLSNGLQWLQENGIPLRVGRRILDHFGREVEAKTTENPYRLLSFSAGWHEVDTIAREKLYIKRDDERRLTAAIEETVYRKLSHGDTFVSRRDLFAGLRAILKDEVHSHELIETVIEHSKVTCRLLFDSEGNAFSLGASILENSVVDAIRLRIGKISIPCPVDQIIRAYEEEEGYGFTLNKEQREAVHLIAENDFAIVTGGTGVGKTTVLKCVFEVLKEQGYDITQLALAGKAVKRMTEDTGRPATTLACFIKSMKQLNEQAESGRSKATTRYRKALVIDEASMVDLISFSSILRLVDDDTKIVLIGDPDQLPPVGPGLILHCLMTIQMIPHVELKIVKRFGSEIVDVANLVKEGKFPEIGAFNESVRFIEASEDEMEELGSSMYLERVEDSIVLCATRRVAHSINLKIQESLTRRHKPLRLFNSEVDMWEHIGFYEGDLLISTRNHWDIGIQNGSLGKLIEIFDEPMLLDSDEEGNLPALGWIEWDDGEKRPLREDLFDDLELGYALTVHKSQGSQWKRVIVCLPTQSGAHISLVERSLVYTAITRSQQEVIIYGQHDHIEQAVKREKAANRRKVGIAKRLAQMAIEHRTEIEAND